jgi:hypothetical protein
MHYNPRYRGRGVEIRPEKFILTKDFENIFQVLRENYGRPWLRSSMLFPVNHLHNFLNATKLCGWSTSLSTSLINRVQTLLWFRGLKWTTLLPLMLCGALTSDHAHLHFPLSVRQDQEYTKRKWQEEYEVYSWKWNLRKTNSCQSGKLDTIHLSKETTLKITDILGWYVVLRIMG